MKHDRKQIDCAVVVPPERLAGLGLDADLVSRMREILSSPAKE